MVKRFHESKATNFDQVYHMTDTRVDQSSDRFRKRTSYSNYRGCEEPHEALRIFVAQDRWAAKWRKAAGGEN